MMLLKLCLKAFLFTLFISPSFASRALLRITAGSEVVDFKKNGIVKLAALHNDVIFEFSPLKDSSLHYEYKLINFDHEWIIAVYPVTRYTNLTGNDYTFVIRSVKGKNILATESILVSVEKELREEWWFVPSIIFYAILLISAAIYFFLLYNFRQKLKLQSMRYKIASDLHDEVGATLSSIAISTRLVRNKVGGHFPDVQPILDRIKSDSEDTIHTIRDTVWAINPDNDAPEKLFEKMRSFAVQLFSGLDIVLDFNNQLATDSKMKFSMEQRRNIFLLFKEATNNIAKHSGASQVSISVVPHGENIHLVIEDNGVGFDTNVTYEGNGLKSLKNRALDGFMDFSLVSAPGKGTRIELEIPEV